MMAILIKLIKYISHIVYVNKVYWKFSGIKTIDYQLQEMTSFIKCKADFTRFATVLNTSVIVAELFPVLTSNRTVKGWLGSAFL